MKPYGGFNPDGLFHQGTHDEALAAKACAESIVAGAPQPGCNVHRFAQGDTCGGGAVQGTINGAVGSEPESDAPRTDIDLGVCAAGEHCPRGFCYWEALHGPLWQTSDNAVPFHDEANFVGSYARIYTKDGQFRAAVSGSVPGSPPARRPGGKFGCAHFSSVVGVPNPDTASHAPWALNDPTGTRWEDEVDISDLLGQPTLNILSGFIGNVAQANGDVGDFLKVYTAAGSSRIAQVHLPPPGPLTAGPLTGEALTVQIPGRTPQYAATNVTVPYGSTSVRLVDYPQSLDVYCFITGISGAWSNREISAPQPYAEITYANGKELWLQVFPSDGPNRVNAWASCLVRR